MSTSLKPNIPFFQKFDFLSRNVNDSLVNTTLQAEHEFHKSSVESEDGEHDHYRKSRLLPKPFFETFVDILEAAIIRELHEIFGALNVPPIDKLEFEMQLTAHNDGDFYKPHIDNGDGETRNRYLTFVYYFHRLPKQFEGGNLLILSNPPHIIIPENNMIVFFKPSLVHGISTVKCSSKDFTSSRFTINGWIIK